MFPCQEEQQLPSDCSRSRLHRPGTRMASGMWASTQATGHTLKCRPLSTMRPPSTASQRASATFLTPSTHRCQSQRRGMLGRPHMRRHRVMCSRMAKARPGQDQILRLIPHQALRPSRIRLHHNQRPHLPHRLHQHLLGPLILLRSTRKLLPRCLGQIRTAPCSSMARMRLSRMRPRWLACSARMRRLAQHLSSVSCGRQVRTESALG